MTAVLCRCGHAERVHHGDGCRGCGCGEPVPAACPDTARARALTYGVEQQRLVSALRRSVAARAWDEALGAVLALQQLDREHAAAVFADAGYEPARRRAPRARADGAQSDDHAGARAMTPPPAPAPVRAAPTRSPSSTATTNETEDEIC